MRPKKLHRLGRRLAVGMHHVVAISLDDHERIAADDGTLALGIVLERLTRPRRIPFRTLAVEPLRPRERIVGAVGSFLDPARHTHVVDLAHAGRVVAGVLEVLRPRRAVADLRTRTRIAQHSRRMRVVTRQERSA